jgi:hypothetical protein
MAKAFHLDATFRNPGQEIVSNPAALTFLLGVWLIYTLF